MFKYACVLCCCGVDGGLVCIRGNQVRDYEDHDDDGFVAATASIMFNGGSCNSQKSLQSDDEGDWG